MFHLLSGQKEHVTKRGRERFTSASSYNQPQNKSWKRLFMSSGRPMAPRYIRSSYSVPQTLAAPWSQEC